jgi:hypothetical protein
LLISRHTQDPKVKTGFHIPEYRLQQDATVKQALGKVNLTHRYMLEERFVHNASKVTLCATTFYLRFRYRVQADYTLEEEKYYLKELCPMK